MFTLFLYSCGHADFILQGCGPTVARAMVVNAAQLASYSQAKQFLLSTCKCLLHVLLHRYSTNVPLLVKTSLLP